MLEISQHLLPHFIRNDGKMFGVIANDDNFAASLRAAASVCIAGFQRGAATSASNICKFKSKVESKILKALITTLRSQ